ncbi:MAG: S9 family peptidase [Blastocatellia bacterium]
MKQPFRICFLFIFLFVFHVAATAQPRRAMTFEDIVSLNRASDAQLSPDIRRVAYVATAWDREADRFNSDIYLASADFFQPSIRLTFNARRDDQPRWSPDGRRLAFLSEREGNTGAQIYLLNLGGGEATRLTAHKAAVQNYAWSADGRWIAFLAEEAPATETKPKTKAPVVVDGEYHYAQLWIANPDTGEVKQLTTGRRHIVDFDWSRDGARIVYTARPTPKLADLPGTEIYITQTDQRAAPSDTMQARPLITRPGAESQPRFSPDGQRIAFLATADSDLVTGPERMHLVSSQGGEIAVLAKTFNGYIKTFRWAMDGVRLIFSAGVGVNEHVFSTDISDRGLVPVTNGEGVNTLTSISPDGFQAVFIHENPQMASEVMTISARNPVFFQMTRLNPQCEAYDYGRVDTIRWKSNDGTDIEGLLFYPLGYETGQRYPLLTYIHGGPEGAYVKSFNASWSAFPQVYAGNGYAVFMPNFRGSANYGAKFAQANKLAIGKVDYEDILSGIDDLVKRGVADENRLAIAGWSYGGYMSAWMIGHTQRFKCTAWGAGLSNAVSYWATADIQWSRERLHGGAPWENRKVYDEASPLTYLAQAKTPALIFHGEKDERVPLGQSQENYQTLRRMGVPTQLVIYPEQGHGLLVPSYQLDKMRREFAWIEQYVKAK